MQAAFADFQQIINRIARDENGEQKAVELNQIAEG